ncbi:GNAT family N-acetyltransferase [Deinococcus cellulosilyticus]|uniref:GNAT family N-acetyltransferase n=1 Tax=Deinococcus cellulosilyticus (strain DSM 18568 / NBRC 106333 / KACC 11606 / 5516J-15) TaxID=1223518 RepID=A0A511N2K0_DEIC1|nr:GNAT family N-acetyltransferase [Deinococcus cellulosilyticus]GEM47085.1 GNAT family N-acetyltransferase [Deinococcus cellulosilyticus NBRC 106333 = KACC 11606]
MQISFLPLQDDHLTLLHCWLQQPHVREFWDDGDRTLEDVQASYGSADRDVDAFLILLEDCPIGYIQAYPVDAESPFVFCRRGNTWGMDLFIGEVKHLGKGLGFQAVQVFADFLHTEYGADRVLIDPSIRNHRAIHIYQKAGFEPVAELVHAGERLLLLRRDRPSPIQ